MELLLTGFFIGSLIGLLCGILYSKATQSIDTEIDDTAPTQPQTHTKIILNGGTVTIPGDYYKHANDLWNKGGEQELSTPQTRVKLNARTINAVQLKNSD